MKCGDINNPTSVMDAVIFDLDGTLLDTLEDIAASVNAVLKKYGFPEHATDDYRYMVGEGLMKLVTRALPADRRDETTIRMALDALRSEYDRRWNQTTKLYDGIDGMLDWLIASGRRLAVLSNKPDEFTKRCVVAMLPRWHFDAVHGQRNGFPPKPDPAGANQIVEQLNIPPHRIMFVGDSGVDMKTALAAGMYPAGVLWGFREAGELKAAGARSLIEHPRALQTLLQELSLDKRNT
jgi:phosphoglycolate phosphatase